MVDIERADRLRQQIHRSLATFNGHLWREVQGEFHEMYQELPFWILLYEDSDPMACHQTFASIVSPHIKDITPLNFTVSYSIYTDTADVSIDTFMSNQEITDAAQSGIIGTYPQHSSRPKHSVFVAATSGKRPTPTG